MPLSSRFKFILNIGLLLISFNAVSGAIFGKVISVADGDTITIVDEDRKQHKIRLVGIDAPEIHQSFGIESRNTLKEVVLNRDVKVETSKTDKYGRSVGKLIFKGKDISLSQVQNGMAWVYTEYLKELSVGDASLYLDAEMKSKSEGLGIWSSDKPIEPWIWRNLKVLN